MLPEGTRGGLGFNILIGLGVVALTGAGAVEIMSQWQAGLRQDADAHGAMVYMAAFLQLKLTLPILVMAGFAVARSLTGNLDRRRRGVYDNLALFWHYAVGQSLFGLLLIHGFPRLVG